MASRRLASRTSLGALAVAVGLVVPSAGAAHSRYEVAWGDTLSGLALRFGTTVGELARANGLGDPHRVLAGSTIVVPGAAAAGALTPYRVQWGDTLSGIAARHGTSLGALAGANGLDPGAVLYAGTVLRVPGAVGSGAQPAGWSVERALDSWADRYGVDRSLVRALAWMESGYQTDVVSVAGARGVMQVTPAAWSFVEEVLLGREVAPTAEGNIEVGVAYLDHLLHSFGGDERLALAAYYQGVTSIRLEGLLRGTRAYVADVLALQRQR